MCKAQCGCVSINLYFISLQKGNLWLETSADGTVLKCTSWTYGKKNSKGCIWSTIGGYQTEFLLVSLCISNTRQLGCTVRIPCDSRTVVFF